MGKAQQEWCTALPAYLYCRQRPLHESIASSISSTLGPEPTPPNGPNATFPPADAPPRWKSHCRQAHQGQHRTQGPKLASSVRFSFACNTSYNDNDTRIGENNPTFGRFGRHAVKNEEHRIYGRRRWKQCAMKARNLSPPVIETDTRQQVVSHLQMVPDLQKGSIE